MKSANTTQLRPIDPSTTGATSTIAPRGTPYGTGEETARAKASFSFTTVMSPDDLAAPFWIGVGPTITRTAAWADVDSINRRNKIARIIRLWHESTVQIQKIIRRSVLIALPIIRRRMIGAIAHILRAGERHFVPPAHFCERVGLHVD